MTRARQPPSDAVILFDGASLAAWRTAKGETPKWKVENGYMEVVKGAGDILTREEFGDSQLRVEWRTPTPPSGDSQERGNSGVFLFGLYEVQVLDKFRQPYLSQTAWRRRSTGRRRRCGTYSARRECGRAYDIVFKAPRFKEDKLVTPGYVTVYHNRMVTQNHTEILEATGNRVLPKLLVRGPQGPLRLQDHNERVRYRNIWFRTPGEVK
jgi:hypothetical protein